MLYRSLSDTFFTFLSLFIFFLYMFFSTFHIYFTFHFLSFLYPSLKLQGLNDSGQCGVGWPRPKALEQQAGCNGNEWLQCLGPPFTGRGAGNVSSALGGALLRASAFQSLHLGPLRITWGLSGLFDPRFPHRVLTLTLSHLAIHRSWPWQRA